MILSEHLLTEDELHVLGANTSRSLAHREVIAALNTLWAQNALKQMVHAH
jgi:hypothetical protein